MLLFENIIDANSDFGEEYFILLYNIYIIREGQVQLFMIYQ